MNNKLKPCPFCGAEAYMWPWNYGTAIQCSKFNNHTHVIQVSAETSTEAIENWNNRCPDCGQLLDQRPEVIAKAEKVSADLKECRKLGLHGVVRKNEKGKWEEVKNGI